MHKSEPVLENKMHKIPLDFEIQTDHPSQARRIDLVLINQKKRIYQFMDFDDHKVKIKEGRNWTNIWTLSES